MNHWLYRRSRIYRDVWYLWQQFKKKRIARYMLRHKMWWNKDDADRWEYIKNAKYTR